MSKLTWDQVGERFYETGVDHSVLYIPNAQGEYESGYSWSGMVGVTESPSGAEANAQYADNIKYLNLVSAEEFGGTIEAFTYPDEFEQCDGTASPVAGVTIGQQNRKTFGLSYRTKIGSDLESDHAYKIHLLYGALASPSEKAYKTVNDSPEAITFSWEFKTTPVDVGTVGGVTYKPTASLVIDSSKTDATVLATIEDILYGTEGVDARLPLPAEIFGLLEGTVVEVAPVAPSYDDATHTITIPTVTGVVYKVNGSEVTGTVVITDDTIVTAHASMGYKFPKVTDNDWLFEF